MKQVHLDKADLSKAKIVDIDPGPLDDGAIRLAVESFSVTSNNVTYAVVGDGFGYWNFFPAPDGSGIVPMWGHARVVESRHQEFEVGERVYGYLPMATHVDVVPGRIGSSGFIDTAAHRQPMSPIYNQYSRLAADPEHDPQREGERMVFGPLFKTGFLIESFMRREGWFGAGQVILTSASSKTALGLASVARHRSPQIRRVGLTSSANVDFVRKTGLYDEVVAYDAIGTLPAEAAVSVDFAGNAAVLSAIHAQMKDALAYSCLVGATHIESRASPRDLVGPAPVLFFAPDHAVALFREVGPEVVSRQMAESMQRFLDEIEGTVEIERRQGIEAAKNVFLEMTAGSVDPKVGIVIEP